jgi:Rhodopirellula transposase DDE domain
MTDCKPFLSPREEGARGARLGALGRRSPRAPFFWVSPRQGARRRLKLLVLCRMVYKQTMITTRVVDTIRKKYELLHTELDERRRRLWAASEAQALGHGGVVAVAKATGLAQSTIRLGQHELHHGDEPAPARAVPRRIRHPGGGRKALVAYDPAVVLALEALVEPTTRRELISPLRWTCKSTRKLAAELTQQGHPISHTTVARMLKALGYSLQASRKTKEGNSHPDPNAQFEYIHQQLIAFQQHAQPIVSVDTKKKERVGDFANGEREYQPNGSPETVRVYDFIDKELGQAMPYGVYDLTANQGWISVGTDHDTAQFAVETLQRWWKHMGRPAYPSAQELLIIVDGGGSNVRRSRLWKVELQRLADEIGLWITVCHLPPGTSKWNKIEHRMFCHITENWRGHPLISHEVIVNLIAHTTTQTGLRIHTERDTATYPTGLKVSNVQMQALELLPALFYGNDWNYTIRPRISTNQ